MIIHDAVRCVERRTCFVTAAKLHTRLGCTTGFGCPSVSLSLCLSLSLTHTFSLSLPEAATKIFYAFFIDRARAIKRPSKISTTHRPLLGKNLRNPTRN